MENRNDLNSNTIDEAIITHLIHLGVSPYVAKALTYVSQVNECCSIDIENAVNLRQPEVSIAMRELSERGWVRKRHKKQVGKGRPTHYYRLSKTFTDIIDVIIQEKLDIIEEQKDNINQLRNIITDN